MTVFRAVVLVLAFAILALGLGWLSPGRPPAPLQVTRFPHTAPEAPIAAPGAAASTDLDDLDDEIGQDGAASSSPGPDALAARAAAPPPRPRPPPPPPPPDVGLVFRQQVRAIVEPRPGEGLVALLRDPASATGQSRLLKVGDKFDGPWRLAELSMSEAVLRNGVQIRRVPLYGGVGGG